MDRPEIYDLKALKLAFGMETRDVIKEMNLMGWNMSKSTMSRLRNGSDLNIDVAGLPFFAIRRFFPNAVACSAQTAIWVMRRAVMQKLKGDELEEVLSEAEEHLVQARDLLDQLKPPVDEEMEAERALDSAAIEEGYGQLLATRREHHLALARFLKAYAMLLPYAGRSGCSVGISISLSRVLGAALSEAYDCDDQAGRVVGAAPIDSDWYLWRVLKHYKNPSAFALLADGINRTGDDRVAANHSDGFALAKEPREAARMMQLGLAHAKSGTAIDTWQPLGRSSPVVAEPYMKDALAEYSRLRSEENSQKANTNKKVRTMNRIIVAIIGIVTLIALVTHVDPAKARPERITGIQLATNVG